MKRGSNIFGVLTTSRWSLEKPIVTGLENLKCGSRKSCGVGNGVLAALRGGVSVGGRRAVDYAGQRMELELRRLGRSALWWVGTAAGRSVGDFSLG